MITGNQIRNIENEQIVFDDVKVVRLGSNVYNVLTLVVDEEGNPDTECIKTGHADEIAKFLNGFFDLK